MADQDSNSILDALAAADPELKKNLERHRAYRAQVAAERPTSFAKSVEGLHYESGPLDRKPSPDKAFNANHPAPQPRFFQNVAHDRAGTFFKDGSYEPNRDFSSKRPATTTRVADQHAPEQMSAAFKGVDIGAPPKQLLRQEFDRPQRSMWRPRATEPERVGSEMVRAHAPAPVLRPRGIMAEPSDRVAYNKRLALERAIAAREIINAREGHGNDRQRERGR